jgi:hypothetical protein
MWASLGIGVSGSLIAAAIYYWITEHRLIPALVIGGAWIAGFILTWLFNKKPAPTTVPPSITQNNRQEFNPQINVSVGNSTSTAAASAPAPAVSPKSEPRSNIHFTEMASGMSPNRSGLLPIAIGQADPFAAAMFENQIIEGMELRIPTVKARVIYRRPDGSAILDVSKVAWIPGRGRAYETFEASTPKYLLLFLLARENLLCRTVEPMNTRTAGQRMIPDHHRIDRPVASVEIQLLTEKERLYRVVLNFVDDGTNELPQCTGHTES